MKILYFASLRDRLGTGEEQLELPAGVSTIGELVEHLSSRGGLWSEALNHQLVLCARNQETATHDTAINSGDEIAFFPPVTGG